VSSADVVDAIGAEGGCDRASPSAGALAVEHGIAVGEIDRTRRSINAENLLGSAARERSADIGHRDSNLAIARSWRRVALL